MIQNEIIQINDQELPTFIKDQLHEISLNVIEKKLKSVVLTSTLANEGKSTISFYLAKTFAKYGIKTLYVNCDLRKKIKLSVFSHPAKDIGLSDYILKKAEAIIYPTSLKNLYTVFPGLSAIDSSLVFTSSTFRHLMEQWKNEYQLIIFDSAPILAGTDTLSLSKQADGVIYMIYANKAKKSAVKKGIAKLQNNHIPILGIVLNGARSIESEIGYYYE